MKKFMKMCFVIKIVGKNIFDVFEKMKSLTKKLHLRRFFDFFYFLVSDRRRAKIVNSVEPDLFRTVIHLKFAFWRQKFLGAKFVKNCKLS